jgi:hypothetical protein
VGHAVLLEGVHEQLGPGVLVSGHGACQRYPGTRIPR